jgi:hypothetical protein
VVMALHRAGTAVHGHRHGSRGSGSLGDRRTFLCHRGRSAEREDERTTAERGGCAWQNSNGQENTERRPEWGMPSPDSAAAGAGADGRQDAARIRSARRPGVSEREALERDARRGPAGQV